MIEMYDIKKACNGVLKTALPDIPIYGTGTTEGMRFPCFATEIVPYGFQYESKNFVRNQCGFKATFLQKIADEEEQLKVAAAVRAAFSMKLSVRDRLLDVKKFNYESLGKNNDTIQMTVEFDFYENIRKSETEEIMKNVSVQMERKEIEKWEHQKSL